MGDSAYATRPTQTQDPAPFRQQGPAAARYAYDPAYDNVGSPFGPAKASAGPRTPETDKLHEQSDSASYESARTALRYLTHQFAEWWPELDKLVTDPDTLLTRLITRVKEIYTHAISHAERIGHLLGVAEAGDRSTLRPEVQQVYAAFKDFWPHMHRAMNALPKNEDPSLAGIENPIKAYCPLVGFDDDTIPNPSTREAREDLEVLARAELSHQLDAVQRSLDSVKSGNTEDVARIVVHVQQLQTVMPKPGDQKRLKQFLAELTAIEKDQPEIAGKLDGTYNVLLGLIQ